MNHDRPSGPTPPPSGAPAATTLTTTDGVDLDARLTRPEGEVRAVAVVTHPHPLMGGNMDNPVPAGLAEQLAGAGVAALRFDFRGVRSSGGAHGEGEAEQADVAAAVRAAGDLVPGVPVVGVGYSFGADVLLAVDPGDLAAVVAVAPPLRVLPAESLARHRGAVPTLVLSPAHDQFCDPATAAERTSGWPDTTLATIEGADHFLTGAVGRVAGAVLDLLARPGLLDDAG